MGELRNLSCLAIETPTSPTETETDYNPTSPWSRLLNAGSRTDPNAAESLTTTQENSAWHLFSFQVPPSWTVGHFYYRGAAAHVFLNHMVYSPRYWEMLEHQTFNARMITKNHPREHAWHSFFLSAAINQECLRLFLQGATVHAWLNHIMYSTRTPEMQTHNLIQMFVASGEMSLLYHDPIESSLAQMR